MGVETSGKPEDPAPSPTATDMPRGRDILGTELFRFSCWLECDSLTLWPVPLSTTVELEELETEGDLNLEEVTDARCCPLEHEELLLGAEAGSIGSPISAILQTVCEET